MKVYENGKNKKKKRKPKKKEKRIKKKIQQKKKKKIYINIVFPRLLLDWIVYLK